MRGDGDSRGKTFGKGVEANVFYKFVLELPLFVLLRFLMLLFVRKSQNHFSPIRKFSILKS
jgi:hypothetical protein